MYRYTSSGCQIYRPQEFRKNKTKKRDKKRKKTPKEQQSISEIDFKQAAISDSFSILL